MLYKKRRVSDNIIDDRNKKTLAGEIFRDAVPKSEQGKKASTASIKKDRASYKEFASKAKSMESDPWSYDRTPYNDSSIAITNTQVTPGKWETTKRDRVKKKINL